MNGVIAACGSWPLALHLLRWDTSNAFTWGGDARCKVLWKMTRSGVLQLLFCAGPWREDNCVEMLWASMPRWKFWEFCLKIIDFRNWKKARMNGVSSPFFLKIKDIVRILRHRNRGIDHKIERTSAKTDWHETLCHFSASWENLYHCFLLMCSGQPFFCSLALSRICALAEDVAVDARDVWGLPCNSSVFFAFEQFQSQRWIFMTTSIAVDEFIQNFLLFRSRWGCQIMIQPSIVTFNTAMASPWEARLTRAPWSSRFPPWFFEEASQIPSQATLCLLEQLTTIALQPNQISSLESVKEITYN